MDIPIQYGIDRAECKNIEFIRGSLGWGGGCAGGGMIDDRNRISSDKPDTVMKTV